MQWNNANPTTNPIKPTQCTIGLDEGTILHKNN